MTQALRFTSDFKLGHYMKIPPRAMFWCQVVATVVAGTVQLAVQSWMFSNIRTSILFLCATHTLPNKYNKADMCAQHQVNGFICPDSEVRNDYLYLRIRS